MKILGVILLLLILPAIYFGGGLMTIVAFVSLSVCCLATPGSALNHPLRVKGWEGVG